MAEEVFVGNLPFKTDAATIKGHIKSTAQSVSSIDMPTKPDGSHKGFAIVKFKSAGAAENGITKLNGSSVGGRDVMAKKNNPKPSRVTPQPSPTPQRNGQTPNGVSQRQTRHTDKKDGTVFVSGLNGNTTEKQLKQYFGTHGDVVSCEILVDRVTQASRGAAYVTFKEPSKALEVMLGKHIIMGKPVSIQPRAVQSTSTGLVHVRGPKTLQEKDVRAQFDRFGKILSIRMLKRSYGFAIIQYESVQSATRACEVMNEKELSGHDGTLTVRAAGASTKSSGQPGASKADSAGSNGAKSGQKGQAAKAASGRGGGSMQAIEDRGVNISPAESEIVTAFDSMVKAGHANRSKQRLQASLADTLDKINAGADATGDARAMLLHKWYILLQNDDRPGAYRFEDKDGVELKFRQVFAMSSAIETLMLRCFDSPFTSPISSRALLPACKLTVRTLMCKIMEKTLKGGEEVHHNLLAILDGLIGLKEDTHPRLRQSFSQLAACFKNQSTTMSNPHFSTQVTGLSSQIKALEKATNMPPEMIIARYKELWQLIVDQAGLGVSGKMGFVVQQLQADLRAMASDCDTTRTRCQVEVQNLMMEISKLNVTQQQAVESTDMTLKQVKGRMQQLNSQRATLKKDLMALISESDKLEAEKKRLNQASRNVRKTHLPKQREVESRRAEAEEQFKAEESSQAALDQVGSLLDKAHTFLLDKEYVEPTGQSMTVATAVGSPHPTHMNQSQNGAGPVMGGAVVDVNAGGVEHDQVSPHLNSLAEFLEEAKKLRERRSFCENKLNNMETERLEMLQLEFHDVADDLKRGMERLSSEIQVITQVMQEVEQKSSRVYSWLSGVKASGIGTPQNAADAAQLYQNILTQIGD